MTYVNPYQVYRVGCHLLVKIDGKVYYWTLEFCRKVPLSRSTLLRWLKGGVIQEPIRDRRGWRLFSEDDLKNIKFEIEITHGKKDVYRSKNRAETGRIEKS